MSLTKTPICKFGEKIVNFSLKSTENKNIKLSDIKGSAGTLIIFICNHCPYVKAVISEIVETSKELQKVGISTVAIMSNDTVKYKEDSFENDGKIKVPYFEFKVEDNVLIYQSEYIKGVAPNREDMKHIYDKLVMRPGAYTFEDCQPCNFVVNESGIYVVDLDSYGPYNFEQRIKRWNELVKYHRDTYLFSTL